MGGAFSSVLGAAVGVGGVCPLGITIGGDGSVTISYATTSGLTYHVETTTDLTSSAWTTVPGSTTNAAGGIIIFIDPNAIGDPQRFYRVGSP